MYYTVTNPDGSTNRIVADQAFVEEHFPGAWVLDSDQPAAEPAPPPVYEWYIDVGPFFDRFGAAKMAVLTSTNATVQAIRADLQPRHWVDLKRADVAAGIDAMIALQVPGVTPALKTAVLTTLVTPEENLALRKLYFS